MCDFREQLIGLVFDDIVVPGSIPKPYHAYEKNADEPAIAFVVILDMAVRDV
jgi:hypothetical protein